MDRHWLSVRKNETPHATLLLL